VAGVSFDGRVVVVTGAGRGLGRAHSLELARRGAAVVVNDLGREYADAVVAEIAAAGGRAAASYDSVSTREGGRAIVDTAVQSFGTLDAVVNNAGFMRNAYFDELSPDDLDAMLDVHVRGSWFVTQAAWPVMKEKGYGRVIMTSSAGGLFAMQGEANYAAAKAGVYGLCKALAVEGEPHGILVNTLLPMATTTIAADNPVPDHAAKYPAGLSEALGPRRLPELVAPMVAYLASSACELTGEAFSAGFGRYARVFVGEAQGWVAPDVETVSADDVAAHIDQIRDLGDYFVPRHIYDEVEAIGQALGVL
jgi:NAD(P)-dependent dehydrogenase (short-subunit alcohol dehydrogenase family)